jgi:hypothetical protein
VTLSVLIVAAVPFAAMRASAQTPENDQPPEPATTAAIAATSTPAAESSASFFAEAPPEAPPPLPHKKGLVLEQSLGVLGFAGQFRHVAPPAYWLHTQLGFEVLKWLMLFGEGELAYTDTSVAQDPSKARAFPIFGFGGGVRATIRPSDRVGIFVQGGIGAMKADVPKQALFILGYHDAESFNPYFGARVGVEWYQIDRHFALGLGVGVRSASGFAKLATTSDTPLMWDGAATIRYTF